MSLLPSVQLQPHQQRFSDDAAAAASSGEPFKRLAFWSPGSGKSLAAISSAEQLSPGGYTAIVPASLRTNYRKELNQFTDGKTPVDLVSYSQLSRGYVPKYPDTVVLDEAHRARSGDSVQAARAREIAANARHTILLTGTPTINRFGDAASIVHMLTGNPTTPEEFEARHEGTKTIGPGILGWFKGTPSHEVPTVRADDELRQMLDGKIDYHETKARPDGYPDHVIHEDHHVELSPRQAALYSGMFGRLPWALRWKLQSRYAMTGEDLMRARSFLNGPRQVSLSDLNFRTDGDALKAFESSGKLQKSYALLKDKLDSHPATKAIVFSSFPRSGLDPLSAKLKAEGIPHGIFDGTLNDLERKELVDRFNGGKLRVALISPAASEGISLKGAQLYQQLDNHFNNARLIQAMARGIRFDSHTNLPPELRTMTVQRFYSHVPLSLKDRLLARLGFDRDHKTETVDHYLRDLAGTKDQKTTPLTNLLKDVAAHNRTTKSAAERVNAGDVIRLVRLQELLDGPTKTSKVSTKFHRPENYDKIRNLPDGSELWAGANDWEAGWTWAWVVPKGGNKREDGPVEPEEFINVDHSACPGCKGTGEDSSSKADSLCVKFGKAEVEKWAKGLTKEAAESSPRYVRIKVPGDKAYLLHHYLDADEYDHPAGRIEAGEDYRTAAVRELRERVGYEPHRPDDLGAHTVAGDFAEFTVPYHSLRQVAKPGELGGYSTDVLFGQPHKNQKAAADDLQTLPLQDRLRLAKIYSDMGTPEGYQTKSRILVGAIQQAPTDWHVDSDAGHTLGITHVSGWRYHLPKNQLASLVPLMSKPPQRIVP